MRKSEFEKLKYYLSTMFDFVIKVKGDVFFYIWNKQAILCIDRKNIDTNKRYRFMTAQDVAIEFGLTI